MLIRIVETDSAWVESFSAWIVACHGAKPTDKPLTFELPDTFDLDAYHGIEAANAPSWAETHADAIAWLNGYTGDFPFYVSLKTQLQRNGRLSDKQLDAVYRAIERDAARAMPKPVPVAARTYSLKSGAVIVVSRWIAAKLSREIGRKIPHYTFEVLETLNETDKAYQVKVKLSAMKTSRCGICGLTLTNAASIAHGIGPICAEKYGFSFNSNSLSELAASLETVSVVTWIPKAAIKETVNN